ncbi:aminotransferase [Lentilactobacillus kosonis]|uniref:Aminotransferase n=1 Tax=Lentilactobacillus kosonis TaxID=2810561 RepID=A0A401FJJ3_9LACO|nr:aminotransferase [Lentilactobacillus kosonis]
MNHLEKATALINDERKYNADCSRIDYYDLVIDHAHDATLVDVDGNEYIDLLASASAINVGHTPQRSLTPSLIRPKNSFITLPLIFITHHR